MVVVCRQCFLNARQQSHSHMAFVITLGVLLNVALIFGGVPIANNMLQNHNFFRRERNYW